MYTLLERDPEVLADALNGLPDCGQAFYFSPSSTFDGKPHVGCVVNLKNSKGAKQHQSFCLFSGGTQCPRGIDVSQLLQT
jgi:hypothetical protein